MPPMPEVVLLIGTRKGLWIGRSDDRDSWRLDGPHFLMQGIYAAAIDTRGERPRVLVGATSEHWGPTVFHSDDLGASWVEPVPGAIKFPQDTGASLERVWQLAPDTADRPGVIWAGSEPSALWRSNDGGESFELIRALWDHPHRPEWGAGFGGQAIHSVLPHPTDDDSLLVAMSTGGVYRTDDGGASWSPSNTGIRVDFMPDPFPEFGQCVHKVARHSSRPELLFAQNHGGVFRSDDGGLSWTSIADGLPADFGFPVVVHPHRPETAYVFPVVSGSERIPPDGKARVWRTDDAGESWRELGAGELPDGYYGVVLRDAFCADDADPAGLYLGTRDGLVYASRDEGESWSVVAEHLPDVLCLRAATLP